MALAATGGGGEGAAGWVGWTGGDGERFGGGVDETLV